MKKKGKVMLALSAGLTAGAIVWYKKKHPNAMQDMKQSIKKAALGIADTMDNM